MDDDLDQLAQSIANVGPGVIVTPTLLSMGYRMPEESHLRGKPFKDLPSGYGRQSVKATPIPPTEKALPPTASEVAKFVVPQPTTWDKMSPAQVSVKIHSVLGDTVKPLVFLWGVARERCGTTISGYFKDRGARYDSPMSHTDATIGRNQFPSALGPSFDTIGVLSIVHCECGRDTVKLNTHNDILANAGRIVAGRHPILTVGGWDTVEVGLIE